MNKSVYVVIVIAIVMSLCPNSVSAQETTTARPAAPATQLGLGGFQGTVSAGGNSISDDISISAWIEGKEVAQVQAVNSAYTMLISTGSPAYYKEKTVTFKIDRFQASQTGTWEDGKVKTLDLTINAWPYQCDYYGQVSVDGQHVPDGTEISAWIDSAKVHSTTTLDSLYHLIVPGNYIGKAVTFKVDRNYATQISTWTRSAERELNLSVSRGPLVCGFYGPVTLDKVKAPAGSIVTAWIDGMLTKTTASGTDNFALNIPGNYTGKTVTFQVNGQPANESAVWVRGGNVQTTLNAITTSTPKITFGLSSNEVRPGDTFTLSIGIDPNGHGISGSEITLFSVGTEVMELLIDEVSTGSLLGTDTVEGVKEIATTSQGQTLKFAFGRKGETAVPTASGTLATIGIRIKGGVTPDKYALPNSIIVTDENFNNLNIEPSVVSITVIPKVPGDIDNDDFVGITDLAILASTYGTSRDDDGFRSDADLNSSDEIGIEDLAIVGGNWGRQRSSL